ncbi:DSBA domain-containing protein [Pseudozyma hubeiensis]|nr:DSBA domain-containing protein [Pseudozyma hubeiensis]
MSKPEFLLQVVTDVICPWCFVGSRRLKAFLESDDYKKQIAPHVQLLLKIEPYILDPRLPATSFDTPDKFYDAIERTAYEKNAPPTKKFYYSSKFGSNLDAFDAKISTAADELGMPKFDWKSEGKVGATWNAHRLVLKAGQLDEQGQGKAGGDDVAAALQSSQVRLMDRLYQDFHSNSKDMSDNKYLAGVAKDFDLFDSEDAAQKWLDSDDLEYELGHKLQQADMNGVQSIPFYIVNDGADHMSETGSHDSFLKMMQMAVAPYVR